MKVKDIDFAELDDMLNALHSMQECRDQGHMNRAKESENGAYLSEEEQEILNTAMFPVDQQLKEEETFQKYNNPDLIEDIMNGTIHRHDTNYYERYRLQILDEILEEDNDLIAMAKLLEMTKTLSDAIKDAANTRIHKEFSERAVSTRLAIDLLRGQKLTMTEIQELLPIFSYHDLYELADDHRIGINPSRSEMQKITEERTSGLDADIRKHMKQETEETYPCILNMKLLHKDGFNYYESHQVTLYFRTTMEAENWLDRNGFIYDRYEWQDQDHWIQPEVERGKYITGDIREFEFDDELTKAPDWM